ncbi:50S ribosomal protein L29 [bacterium]|nr:50S ribosomal protein L29 [bacterium]
MSTNKWFKEEKLRDKSVSELRDMARELKSLGFTHRMDRLSGKLENYRIIPQTRRRLAAVNNLIREKELNGGAK